MAHPNNQAQCKKPTTAPATAGNGFTVSGRQKRIMMFFSHRTSRYSPYLKKATTTNEP
jgi:hypothetical protein